MMMMMDDSEERLVESEGELGHRRTPVKLRRRVMQLKRSFRGRSLSDRLTSINQLPSKRALARSREIDQQLTQEYEQRRRELHLLLIGGAGAGKSTFLKQFRIHYGDGFPFQERVKCVASVLENLADAIHIVMDNMRRWGLTFQDDYVSKLASDFRIRCPRTVHFIHTGCTCDDKMDDLTDITEKMIDLHTAECVNNDFEESSNASSSDSSSPLDARAFAIRRFVRHIKNLIEQPEFNECLECKEFFNPPITYAELYFLRHVDRVIQADYVPTLQDILAIRKPTFAVREAVFPIGGTTIRLIDLAGQKSRRNKWIHYFDGVNLVMYFWALTDYAEVLEEDTTVNKMEDSLYTFSEVFNNKYLWHKNFIVFANKSDLFHERLQQFSIKVLFGDFKGSQNDADCVLNFLLSKYSSIIEDSGSKNRRVYTHVTCALDIDFMKTKIKSVLQTISDSNLKGVLAV